MVRDQKQMAKSSELRVSVNPEIFTSARPPGFAEVGILSIAAPGTAQEKNFCHRSHDVYENKGKIFGEIDCSHDVDETKSVSIKLWSRPRYH